MTKKEIIQKNIELTFDFINYLIEHPHIAEQLPNKCEIEFIESNFSHLKEKSLEKKKLIKVSHTFDIVGSSKK